MLFYNGPQRKAFIAAKKAQYAQEKAAIAQQEAHFAQERAFNVLICRGCGATGKIQLYVQIHANGKITKGFRHLYCIDCIPPESNIFRFGEEDIKPGDFLPAIPGYKNRLKQPPEVSAEDEHLWARLAKNKKELAERQKKT